MKHFSLIVLLVFTHVLRSQTFERTYKGGIIPGLTNYRAFIDKNGKTFNLLNSEDGSPSTPNIYTTFITSNNGDSIWEKIIPIPSLGINQATISTAIEFNGNYIFSSVELISPGMSKEILFETTPSGSVVGTYATIADVPYMYSFPAVVKSHSGNHFFNIYTTFTNYYNTNWVLQYDYFMKIEKRNSLNGTLSSNTSQHTTTLSPTNYLISQFLPTLDDGFMLHYQKCNMNDSVFIAKYDQNCNLQWKKRVSQFLSSSNSAGVRNVFQGNDSTYYLSVYTGTNNQYYGTVIRTDKNGNTISSVNIPYGLDFVSGIATNANELMFNYISGVNPIQGGLMRCDTNFNSIHYHPSPFNSDNFVMSQMVPNSYGGGRVAFHNYGVPGFLAGFTNMSFDGHLSTYPVKVNTKIIRDDNKNCVLDASDIKMKNTSLSLTDAQNENYYAFADQNGDYKVNVPFGTYTVSHVPYGYKAYECPSNGITTFTATATNSINVFVFDTVIPNVKDLNIMMSGNFVSSNQNNMWNAFVRNDGTIPFSGLVNIKLDNDMQFTTSNHPIFNYTNNILTFSLTNLAPDSMTNLIFNFNWNSSAQVGNPIYVTGSVVCPGDVYPSNNGDTISGAIYVLKGKDLIDLENSISIMQPLYVNDNKELVYRINFQNILSLAAKDLTMILDIDSSLDISSFRVLKASHQNFTISHRKGNKISIRFDNINLVDKIASDSLSKGSLIFSIKFKEGETPGSIVKNTADLFFDWALKKTNTTYNILRANVTAIYEDQANVKFDRIEFYPNPANGIVYFKNLARNINYKASVTDIKGAIVKEETDIEKGSIDVSGLDNGFYLLNIKSGTQNSIFKLLIAK